MVTHFGGGVYSREDWENNARPMTLDEMNSDDIKSYIEGELDGDGYQVMTFINGHLCWRKDKKEILFLTDDSKLYTDSVSLIPVPLKYAYFLKPDEAKNIEFAYDVRSLNKMISRNITKCPLSRKTINQQQCNDIYTMHAEVFSLESFDLFQLIEHVMHDVKMRLFEVTFVFTDASDQAIDVTISNFAFKNAYACSIVDGPQGSIFIQGGNTLTTSIKLENNKEQMYVSKKAFADEEIAQMYNNVLFNFKDKSIKPKIHVMIRDNNTTAATKIVTKRLLTLFTNAYEKVKNIVNPALPDIAAMYLLNNKTDAFDTQFIKVNELSVEEYIEKYNLDPDNQPVHDTQINKYIENLKIVWYGGDLPLETINKLQSQRTTANNTYNTKAYPQYTQIGGKSTILKKTPYKCIASGITRTIYTNGRHKLVKYNNRLLSIAEFKKCAKPKAKN